MRVLLSTCESRGDVEPMVGLAVRLRALGAEVPVYAPPDFADLLRLARRRSVLDQRGIADRLLSQGHVAQVAGFAGIEFPGWDPTTSHLIAEEPEWGIRRDELGIHSSSKMVDGGPVRRSDFC